MFRFVSFVSVFVCLVSVAHAYDPIPTGESGMHESSIEQSYRNSFVVEPPMLQVPTVLEVPLPSIQLERNSVYVVERETGNSAAGYIKEAYTVMPRILAIETVPNAGAGYLLTDRIESTNLRFAYDESGENRAQIILTSTQPVAASRLQFLFEKNVSLPTHIEVRALNEMGAEEIVLAETNMRDTNVSFIPTTATRWIITLTYAQPLSISEVLLVQDEVEQSVYRGVRFLAQPGKTYAVYINPDEAVTTLPLQSNLSIDEGVLQVATPNIFQNAGYIPADGDEDGIPNMRDNCVSFANTDQKDINGNGRGDVCEDFDRDGVGNTTDNCTDLPNRDQRDTDGDGVGDVCDGEESRLTERLPWVPWAGMGIAMLVLVVLFAVVAQRPIPTKKDADQDGTDNVV